MTPQDTIALRELADWLDHCIVAHENSDNTADGVAKQTRRWRGALLRAMEDNIKFEAGANKADALLDIGGE
jgi:hypothetical protein